MNQFKSTVISIIGIILFVIFLPALLNLLFVLILVVMILIMWQRYRIRKILNDEANSGMNYQRYSSSETNNQDAGVEGAIDVEFSESEETYD